MKLCIGSWVIGPIMVGMKMKGACPFIPTPTVCVLPPKLLRNTIAPPIEPNKVPHTAKVGTDSKEPKV